MTEPLDLSQRTGRSQNLLIQRVKTKPLRLTGLHHRCQTAMLRKRRCSAREEGPPRVTATEPLGRSGTAAASAHLRTGRRAVLRAADLHPVDAQVVPHAADLLLAEEAVPYAADLRRVVAEGVPRAVDLPRAAVQDPVAETCAATAATAGLQPGAHHRVMTAGTVADPHRAAIHPHETHTAHHLVNAALKNGEMTHAAASEARAALWSPRRAAMLVREAEAAHRCPRRAPWTAATTEAASEAVPQILLHVTAAMTELCGRGRRRCAAMRSSTRGGTLRILAKRF